VLYAFFDPNCTPCHFVWKALQAYERAGLQVRWVPVAYQKENSAARAHAVMQASDRAAALRELMQAREHEVARRKNETRDRADRSVGGVTPVADLPSAFVTQLEANLQLMKRFGAPGTPLLVWKDADGKVQLKIGMPRLSQLPAITGLPEQRIDDPELAEFR
ncbi:MAG TPA: disulfide isomerase, partial [Burkholderiales bacterium]